mgnify:FL=1
MPLHPAGHYDGHEAGGATSDLTHDALVPWGL